MNADAGRGVPGLRELRISAVTARAITRGELDHVDLEPLCARWPRIEADEAGADHDYAQARHQRCRSALASSNVRR